MSAKNAMLCFAYIASGLCFGLVVKAGETKGGPIGQGFPAPLSKPLTCGDEMNLPALLRSDALAFVQDPDLKHQLEWQRDHVVMADGPGELPNLASRTDGFPDIEGFMPEEAVRSTLEGLIADSANKVYADTEDLMILSIHGSAIPKDLMMHMGAIREETFRKEGESTGATNDFDEWDSLYDHLLMIDKATMQLVGGYRLRTFTESIRLGDLSGMYTDQFLHYDIEFLKGLDGEVLELGRTFIVPEFQGGTRLMTMWGAIGRYLLDRPEIY
ncbi:MAG: GNAT family N-acetyltransferase, partial [Pseudomonadota bacterium]